MNTDKVNIHEIGQKYAVAVVVATEVPPDAPEAEFSAVIDVMRNRAKASGKSLVEVVLERNQFSAVCREDYWRKAMAGKWQRDHVERCYAMLDMQWPDTTGGATHYYSPISMVPQWSIPQWATKFEARTVSGVRQDYFRFYKGTYP